MKAGITTLTAILALASSMAVRAQTNVQAPSPSQQQNAAPAQTSQWTASDNPNVEKTRAQVYEELVQAQRDGQIATLNRTVYAHH